MIIPCRTRFFLKTRPVGCGGGGEGWGGVGDWGGGAGRGGWMWVGVGWSGGWGVNCDSGILNLIEVRT